MDNRRGGTRSGCREPQNLRGAGIKDTAEGSGGSQLDQGGAIVSKLLIRSGAPDETGCVLNITPESAGWQYIGFQVHRMKAGQTLKAGTGERETCLVVLAG